MPGDTPVRPRSTLLVHCDLDAATEARTALAIDLARRMGAHLVGVAAGDPKRVAGAPRPTGPHLAAAEDELRRALRLAAGEFKARAAQAERANFRWALKPADVFLAEQAVCADLVIVGPQGCGGSASALRLDVDTLLMSSGRPVLIAPEGLDRLDLRRVVVAWKSAREARRAILDSLPLLEMAEDVLVLHIIEDPNERPEDDGLDAVRDWLSPRLARVEVARRAGRPELASVTNDLLDAADAFGAGLIVAGAYSRAPLAERLFGGVTRELLKRGRPARLLSH